MLKGSKILFRISLAIMDLMKGELLAAKEICEVFIILETKLKTLDEPLLLLRHAEDPYFHVSTSYLQEQREEFLPKVIKEMKAVASKDYHEAITNEERRLFHMKSKFLSKFYMHKGVMQHNHRNAEEAGPRSRKGSQEMSAKEKKVPFGFSETSCSPEWPICIFDFTFKSKQTSFFVFRVAKLDDTLQEDYFYSTGSQLTNLLLGFVEEEHKQESGGSVLQPSVQAQEEFVMERNSHYCVDKDFVKCFWHR